MIRSRIRLRAPVVRVPLGDHLLAAHALHEAEGPGAGRVLGDALVAVLLERGRADEHRGAAAALDELAEEVAVGLAQDDLHGALVGGLHFLEELPDPRGVGVGARVELRRVLGRAAVDVVLHRRRVEVRAVVELDALAELEGVGQRVLGDVPRGRELGDELRVGHVGLGEVLVDQALVHLLADPPGHPAARAVRVEDVELALLGDDEGAALLGRPGRAPAWRGPASRGGARPAALAPIRRAAAKQVTPGEPSLDEGRFERLERRALFFHDTLLRPAPAERARVASELGTASLRAHRAEERQRLASLVGR